MYFLQKQTYCAFAVNIYTKFYADTVVVKRVGWAGQFKRILLVRALCVF